MAKLIFNYGAMGSGKSQTLIGTYYNYINLNRTPMVVVPKNQNKIVKSRSGAEIEAVTIEEFIIMYKEGIDVVLVDEAQFLTEDNIEFLSQVSIKGVTVICYGLRTASNSKLFPGSKRLMELADIIEELPTLCYYCGHKARMNIRYVNGIIDKGDNQIVLKSNNNVRYLSVCRKCYYELINNF